MTACASESVEFWRPAELPGVEVLRVKHSERHWRWYHETYSVCSIMTGLGTVEWNYRGRHHSAPAPQMQLYEPGNVHVTNKPLLDCEFRVLFISRASAQAAAEELGTSSEPHWKAFASGDGRVLRALLGLHAALESSADRLEVDSRYASCVRMLFGEFAEDGIPHAGKPSRTALRRARDFIYTNFAQPIALDELSEVAHVSRFHFVRAFAAEFGLPPHAFQMQVRIHRAQDLLAAGQQSATVAAATGFYDQSHFTRHFKRIVGVSPAHYARMVQ